jgi:hypothetical protein
MSNDGSCHLEGRYEGRSTFKEYESGENKFEINRLIIAVD